MKTLFNLDQSKVEASALAIKGTLFDLPDEDLARVKIELEKLRELAKSDAGQLAIQLAWFEQVIEQPGYFQIK
jgi:hypothetical protein